MSSSPLDFIRAYPVILKIWHWAFCIWERTDWLDDENPKDMAVWDEPLGEYKGAMQEWIDLLQEALADQRLAGLDLNLLAEFKEGADAWTTVVTRGDASLVHEHFDAVLEELEEYMPRARETNFGKWGAQFFLMIFDQLSDWHGIVKDDAKYNDLFFEQYALDDIGAESPQAMDFIVDASTFSVRIGSRRPCVLGNTKCFQLLEVLNTRRGKFINLSELAELLGGDGLDVEALQTIKSRLTTKLKSAGYQDLARWIKTETAHYGLFPAHM